jgi:hypothetical protein
MRQDAQHKLTAEIARTCSVVGLEDLHVKGMFKNRTLARAMADAGLGQLLQFFEAKMQAVGGQAIFVDRFFPSTKTCSGCGQVKKRMPLQYRTYCCLKCGLIIDRDLNAALNLEREARRILVEVLHVPVPDSGARSDVKLPCGADVRPKPAADQKARCNGERRRSRNNDICTSVAACCTQVCIKIGAEGSPLPYGQLNCLLLRWSSLGRWRGRRSFRREHGCLCFTVLVQYLMRYLLITEEQALLMLVYLQMPLNSARIFSYTAGKRLIQPGLAQGDWREVFARLLAQQLYRQSPSELAEKAPAF